MLLCLFYIHFFFLLISDPFMKKDISNQGQVFEQLHAWIVCCLTHNVPKPAAAI